MTSVLVKDFSSLAAWLKRKDELKMYLRSTKTKRIKTVTWPVWEEDCYKWSTEAVTKVCMSMTHFTISNNYIIAEKIDVCCK